MPPKRLRSSPEMPLILSANRFRTGASYFPISSAKIQQKNDISKFLPSEMSLKLKKRKNYHRATRPMEGMSRETFWLRALNNRAIVEIVRFLPFSRREICAF